MIPSSLKSGSAALSPRLGQNRVQCKDPHIETGSRAHDSKSEASEALPSITVYLRTFLHVLLLLQLQLEQTVLPACHDLRPERSLARLLAACLGSCTHLVLKKVLRVPTGFRDYSLTWRATSSCHGRLSGFQLFLLVIFMMNEWVDVPLTFIRRTTSGHSWKRSRHTLDWV